MNTNDILKRVAVARMSADLATAIRKEAEAKFKAENADIYEAEQSAKETLASIEDAARSHLLELFDPEKGKKFDGYGFRETIVVTITDVKRAKDWCLRNFTPALKLDDKKFKDAAKDGSIPGDLALVEREIIVTISQDLSSFVESKEE